MNKEVVCMVYYAKITQKIEKGKLHAYQRKLAFRMLRQGFLELFAEEFDEGKVKRTVLGKPYYEGAENRYFNISHCPEAVAVAVARYPVGVDIEGMRNIRCGTVRKCCTPEELRYVLADKKSVPVELSLDEKKRFLHLWTLKESYVKMTGEGLRMPVNTIAFDVKTWQRKGELQSFSYQYFPESLVLAVSMLGKGEVIEQEMVRWKNLEAVLKGKIFSQ